MDYEHEEIETDNYGDVNNYGSFEFTPSLWPPDVKLSPRLTLPDFIAVPVLWIAWVLTLLAACGIAVWRVLRGTLDE